MKRIVSLILAITMILSIAVISATATEIKAGNKHNVDVTNGTYEVASDGWGSYVLGRSSNFEVTMTMHTSTGNPEYGINFAGSDDNGDGVLLEGQDRYMSVFFQGNWAIRLIGCNKGFGNIDGYAWDENTRGTDKGNDDVTVTIKFANKQLSYFMDGKQLGETITLPDSVIFGNVVTLSLKHEGDTISNVVFKDNTKEAKAGNKHNVDVTNGTYEVASDGWGSYVLGRSSNFEVTMTMHTSTGNPEYGINFAGSDDNGDGVLLEGQDRYMSVFFQGNWAIRLIGCNKGFGNIDGYAWDENTRGTDKGNDNVTVTIKFANKQLSYFMDGKQLGETITLPDSVIFGNVVTLSLKHKGDTISNVKFKCNHTYSNGVCVDCGAYEDNIGVHLAGYTLSLNGNIGVNFYMELSDAIASSTDTYMQFTLPDGNTTNVKIADASVKMANGKKYYVFPCDVASYEMTGNITAQIKSADSSSKLYEFKVRDYAQYIIDNPDCYTADDVKFAKALLNYGTAAQNYFGVATDDLANKLLDEKDKKITALTADDLKDYAVKSASMEGVGTFIGANLALGSQTSLRAYFKLASSVNENDITFAVNGTTVTAEKVGEYYRITADNIKAFDLDSDMTFTATVNGQVLVFKCSAMSYCYSALASGNHPETLNTLLYAMRAYQLTSEIYRG